MRLRNCGADFFWCNIEMVFYVRPSQVRPLIAPGSETTGPVTMRSSEIVLGIQVFEKADPVVFFVCARLFENLPTTLPFAGSCQVCEEHQLL